MKLYDKSRQLYYITSGFCTEIILKKINKNRFLALYVIDYSRNENKIYSLDGYNHDDLHANMICNRDLDKLIKIRNDIIKICGKNVQINYQKLCKIYNLNYHKLHITYGLDFDILLVDKQTCLKRLFYKLVLFYDTDLLIEIKNIISCNYVLLIF